MLAILPLVFSFFTGLAGPVSSVVNNITDLKKIREKAKADKDIKQIDAEISLAQDKKAVLIGMMGNRVLSMTLAVLLVGASLPAIAILNKLAYDKIGSAFYGCRGTINFDLIDYCKQFGTDPLGPELAALVAAVIGFLFLYAGTRK